MCPRSFLPVVAHALSQEYDLGTIEHQHLAPGAPVRPDGSALGPVKAIGTGKWHLMLVTAEGAEVWVTGLNNYGQLGLGFDAPGADGKVDSLSNRSALERVESLSGRGVTAVAGGAHHSLALAGGEGTEEGGAVYAWGRSDYGQLGGGKAVMGGGEAGSFHPHPIEVPIPADSGGPKALSVGENHNLVLTTKGGVYSWGFGEMGQLGHFKDEDELSPKAINLKKCGLAHVKVLQITGGGQHSMFLGKAFE